jgi:hypothetical protein
MREKRTFVWVGRSGGGEIRSGSALNTLYIWGSIIHSG